MSIQVKICGLSEPATLEAALSAGADLVGLVSFPKSPRHVSPDEAAALARLARGRARVALLTVNAADEELAALMDATLPDVLQLHGGESPERTAALKARYGVEIWKAVAVASAEDLAAADRYRGAADRLLFDAKPPAGATLPGGNGRAFDWSLLADLDPPGAFVLSGGLDPANVGEAIRVTRAAVVDVSSGVESAPGVKDPRRIAAFLREARAAAARLEGPVP